MKYLFCNWKMYVGLEESRALAAELAGMPFDKSAMAVAVFPTALSFSSVRGELNGSEVKMGAQNVAWTPSGAYTGALSAVLFAEAGAEYALVGHSERRHVFGETETAVHNKLVACLDAGLIPVLCIGETREDREEDKRSYRLQKQLKTALEGVDIQGPCMVSYEPVWAIGTGDACLPSDAEDVIGFIKMELRLYTQTDIPVLYGGSVNPGNVANYMHCQSIAGVLVGGASAKADSLAALVAHVDAAA